MEPAIVNRFAYAKYCATSSSAVRPPVLAKQSFMGECSQTEFGSEKQARGRVNSMLAVGPPMTVIGRE